MLGGLLFGGAGGWGGGGGGIGLIEILLLAGAGYLIYRFVASRRQTPSYSPGSHGGQEFQPSPVSHRQPAQGVADTGGAGPDDVARGILYIRRMDPSFEEKGFPDLAMDLFFRIQGGWMNRDLSTVSDLMTGEMRKIFQEEIDGLLREKTINRLENIAVRKVEIAEAWQESGQDFITTLVHANLLDYTTDESTGAVVSGSKTEPVKFEEFWTFTRPVGRGQWKLSAITQP
jgi:predicted lipid-binding transport protein (Tim44 family)